MAVMAVPTMKPLTAIPPSLLATWRAPAGRRRRAYSARPGCRSSGEARLETSLDLRPFFGDDAEVGGVADRTVGHDHVVAEDPLECRADAGERVARSFVVVMGLELDPVGSERLERVGQLEELRLAVRAGPLERRGN